MHKNQVLYSLNDNIIFLEKSNILLQSNFTHMLQTSNNLQNKNKHISSTNNIIHADLKSLEF